MSNKAAAISGLVVLTLTLFYCEAIGDYGSLRCQGKIIDPGMSMAQVLALCGPPRSRQIEEAPIRSRVVAGFTRFAGLAVTEYWEYDRGWGKFPAVLTFQDGALKRVDYLSYRSGSR